MARNSCTFVPRSSGPRTRLTGSEVNMADRVNLGRRQCLDRGETEPISRDMQVGVLAAPKKETGQYGRRKKGSRCWTADTWMAEVLTWACTRKPILPIRVRRSAPRTQIQRAKAAGWFEEGSPAAAQPCETSAGDEQEGASDSPDKRFESRGIERGTHVPLADDHDRQKSHTFRRAILGRRNTSTHGQAPRWRACCAGGAN